MNDRPTDARPPDRRRRRVSSVPARRVRFLFATIDRASARDATDAREEKSDASRGNERLRIDTSDGVGASRVWVWSRTRGTYSVVCEWYVYVGAGV